MNNKRLKGVVNQANSGLTITPNINPSPDVGYSRQIIKSSTPCDSVSLIPKDPSKNPSISNIIHTPAGDPTTVQTTKSAVKRLTSSNNGMKKQLTSIGGGGTRTTKKK